MNTIFPLVTPDEFSSNALDPAFVRTRDLAAIPSKKYFTIGETSELCGVKPHVLRYWEQEFTQLNPIKRRGNRRYYQHHELRLIRQIRELLYEKQYTISGAIAQINALGSKQFAPQPRVKAAPAIESYKELRAKLFELSHLLGDAAAQA